MLMIRFQRIGRTNDPAFRISVLEKERAAQAGAIVEQLGTYNPKSKALTLNEARLKEWMAKGAQPTPSIWNLLINKGILEGKKIDAIPMKTLAKKGEEAAVAAAAPAAGEAPTEAEVAAEAEPAPAEETPAGAEEAAPETPAA